LEPLKPDWISFVGLLKIDKTDGEPVQIQISKKFKSYRYRPVLSKTDFINFGAYGVNKYEKINKNRTYCCQSFVQYVFRITTPQII
jgi:hypothetical protein